MHNVIVKPSFQCTIEWHEFKCKTRKFIKEFYSTQAQPFGDKGTAANVKATLKYNSAYTGLHQR